MSLIEKSSLGASKMQLDEEFVTIPRELYNHLREAHKLLGKGLQFVRDSGKFIELAKAEEVCELVAACSCVDPPWAFSSLPG